MFRGPRFIIFVNYSDNKGDHIKMIRNTFFYQVTLKILRYGDFFLESMQKSVAPLLHLNFKHSWNIKHKTPFMKDVLANIDIPVLKVKGMELGNVHKYNYLGVIVDDKLLFDEFVEHKYNNINVRILQLMRMRQYITTDTALTIYRQMIIPLFDYADFMVESASKVKIAKLEKTTREGSKMH